MNVTADILQEDRIPYFLTDLGLTVAQLKGILSKGPEADSDALLARLLAEARPADIWKLTTPDRVWSRWHRIAPRLGWSRAMWTHVFECWRRDGLVA